jgi:hypothetical protein
MKDNFEEKRFITFTKAARLLGYTSSQIINRLIDEKHLQGYSFPDCSTRKVCRNEVLNLIKLSVSKDSEDKE